MATEEATLEEEQDDAEVPIRTVQVPAAVAFKHKGVLEAIRDVLVKRFARIRKLANTLSLVHVTRKLDEDPDYFKTTAPNHVLGSMFFRHCVRLVCAGKHSLKKTPELADLEESLKVFHQWGGDKDRPDCQGLTRLLETAGDMLHVNAREHIETNAPRWIQRWLMVQLFHRLGGWGNGTRKSGYVVLSDTAQCTHLRIALITLMLHPRCQLTRSVLRGCAWFIYKAWLDNKDLCYPKALQTDAHQHDRVAMRQLWMDMRITHGDNVLKHCEANATYHKVLPLCWEALKGVREHRSQLQERLKEARQQLRAAEGLQWQSLRQSFHQV